MARRWFGGNCCWLDPAVKPRDDGS
ncbi:MAG: palindromic element RPE4 domain-containing protein [Deltaproteobacteria bacterium]|nr:palindromic element RPE4 domain-containing protein [Deltaproteobacteria bacterium]